MCGNSVEHFKFRSRIAPSDSAVGALQLSRLLLRVSFFIITRNSFGISESSCASSLSFLNIKAAYTEFQAFPPLFIWFSFFLYTGMFLVVSCLQSALKRDFFHFTFEPPLKPQIVCHRSFTLTFMLSLTKTSSEYVRTLENEASFSSKRSVFLCSVH